MTIHFSDPSAVEATLAHVETSTSPVLAERTATIDMKHRHESEILAELMKITKAAPVEPTQEELDQLRDLEERQKLSEIDSKRSHAVNEKRKKREAMLAQARGEVQKLREA